MCSAAGVIGGVIGGANAYMGAKENAAEIGNQIAAQNASKLSTIKSMNYELANLSQGQRDQYAATVTQLQEASIQSIRNQGTIRAAMGDSGLEGRSMDAVMREVEGQDLRASESLKANYMDSFWSIQSQKETTVLNADAAIKGMPTIRKPSSTAVMLGVVSGAINGSTAGMNYSTAMKKGGR